MNTSLDADQYWRLPEHQQLEVLAWASAEIRPCDHFIIMLELLGEGTARVTALASELAPDSDGRTCDICGDTNRQIRWVAGDTEIERRTRIVTIATPPPFLTWQLPGVRA